MSQDEYSRSRPVLTNQDMMGIHGVTMYANTQFVLPPSLSDPSTGKRVSKDISGVAYSVDMKWFTGAGDMGHTQAPDLFYKGVTFGITTENSHDLFYTSTSTSTSAELEHDLLNMFPKPTHVMHRSAWCNQSTWTETGYAVYFSYEDLQEQGKLSSDKAAPWKRVSEDVIQLARKHKQVRGFGSVGVR